MSRDTASVGGRGARERILRAADRLFYQQGIHATGVAALAEEAHVSTRTLYQHFATKNALVEAYLAAAKGTPLSRRRWSSNATTSPQPSDF